MYLYEALLFLVNVFLNIFEHAALYLITGGIILISCFLF